MPGTRVWIGDYGAYTIPPSLLADTHMRKNGWPDKRYRTGYALFMEWVGKQENKAKEKINGKA